MSVSVPDVAKVNVISAATDGSELVASIPAATSPVKVLRRVSFFIIFNPPLMILVVYSKAIFL
jgi:hypothetical protein